MYNEEEQVEQEQPGVVERTVKKGVNYGKNKAINAFWEWIKPYLIKALPILVKGFLIVCVIGLIIGIIQQVIIPVSATGNADSVSSVQDADIVYLGENGEYKISVENLADQILENLETKKINNEAVGFTSDNLDNMIDKYIKAEIQTTYPETGVAGNEFDGIIKIYRTGTTSPLKYMEYDDFKDYSEGDVLEYFSLDPENFKLWIAREGDSVTYKDRNGNPINGIEGASNEGIIKESIEYKTALQNYSVPLNFFTILHMMSQDVDFMNDFVDKVLGRDKTEPIVLTYVESKSTTITQKEYYGEKTINTITETKNADGFRIGYNKNKGSTEEISESETLNYYTPDYFEEVRVVTSGSLQVTKADTWLKTVEKVITENNSGDEEFISGEPLNVANINNIYIGEENPILNEENNTTKYIKYVADIAVKEITSTKNEDIGYTSVESQNKINVDEFAAWLVNDYSRVANNLATAPSTLFYFLQQDESTQQLEKIMKYVIYKLNGINYGYTEDNIGDILNEYYYNGTSGIYGGSVQEKIWWALIDAGCTEYAAAGVLGNVAGESGGRSNQLEYDKLEGYTSESYTDAVNSGAYSKQQFMNDGVGYGIVQWTTSDRKGNLYTFLREDKNVSIDDENMQIEFMLGEIFGKEYANGRADKITAWFEDNYGCTFDGWMNASSPSEAARQFCWIYENPNYDKAHISKRQANAEYWYQQFHGKTRRRNHRDIYRNYRI